MLSMERSGLNSLIVLDRDVINGTFWDDPTTNCVTTASRLTDKKGLKSTDLELLSLKLAQLYPILSEIPLFSADWQQMDLL